MSDALDYVRNNCGIAGEEVAEMVDSLERQRSALLASRICEEPLRQQIAELKKQRDEAEADKLETYQRLCDSRAKHKAALEQIAKLEAELERERMCHAACGVVALANTRESAETCRKMHPDYYSASVQDVANAVDREMSYREQIATLEHKVKIAVEMLEQILILEPWQEACKDALGKIKGE